jgi:hypothetical protein
MKPLLLFVVVVAISAMNSLAQEPSSLDVRKDANGKVIDTTEHFTAPPPKAPPKLSNEEYSLARGGAYQATESTSGYNHDGLAFAGLNAKLVTAAKIHANEVANGYVSTTDYDDGTPFAFAKVDCSEYQRNIKSGKWKKFENGEEPPLARF